MGWAQTVSFLSNSVKKRDSDEIRIPLLPVYAIVFYSSLKNTMLNWKMSLFVSTCKIPPYLWVIS